MIFGPKKMGLGKTLSPPKIVKKNNGSNNSGQNNI